MEQLIAEQTVGVDVTLMFSIADYRGSTRLRQWIEYVRRSVQGRFGGVVLRQPCRHRGRSRKSWKKTAARKLARCSARSPSPVSTQSRLSPLHGDFSRRGIRVTAQPGRARAAAAVGEHGNEENPPLLRRSLRREIPVSQELVEHVTAGYHRLRFRDKRQDSRRDGENRFRRCRCRSGDLADSFINLATQSGGPRRRGVAVLELPSIS